MVVSELASSMLECPPVPLRRQPATLDRRLPQTDQERDRHGGAPPQICLELTYDNR